MDFVTVSGDMQIPSNSFKLGLGFLHEPQPGSRQQVNNELQVKAQAAGPQAVSDVARAADALRATGRAVKVAPSSGATGAKTLEEAVRGLAEDGRLPRRGSLIDIQI